ncbi:MAG: class I SAM-dependent methyltransferase [Candidatus Nanohaloarchaea archaeon]
MRAEKRDLDSLPWREVKEAHRFKKEVVEDFLSEHGIENALDVGAGSGFISEAFTDQELYAVDRRSEQVDYSENYDEVIEFDLNSRKALDLDREFDLVICFDVLEHILAPRKRLDDISQNLAPGGYLIASTHNFANLGNRLKLLKGEMPGNFFRNDYTGMNHAHPFTWGTFRKTLEEAGLKIEDSFAYTKGRKHRLLKGIGGGMFVIARKNTT